MENTTEKYEKIKEEYEQIQGQIEMLDETIEQSRSMLTDTSVLRGKLEGEINVLKEQIKSAGSNEEHLKSRKMSVQKEIDEKTKDKDSILSDKEIIDKQVAEIECSRNQAREMLFAVQSKIEELNNNIECGKNTIIDALNSRATIKSKLGRYDTMTEQINIRKAELTSRLLRIKSDEAQQEAAMKKLQEEFENEFAPEIEETLLRWNVYQLDGSLLKEVTADYWYQKMEDLREFFVIRPEYAREYFYSSLN